ncbi:MAG: cobalamin-dependent protein [Pseudomonadota bacterium]
MDNLALNPAECEETLVTLAREALPSSDVLLANGQRDAAGVTLGRSRFLETHGFGSEREYKESCITEGRVMYHAHIGMNDATATVKALERLGDLAQEQNFRIDRAGFALDRRMGLPESMRAEMPAETGPMLENPEDWHQIARCADIQPHMGDFMIGQPASVENTLLALEAGCTTVGNLSQFFSFEAPGWRDTQATTAATVQAIATLGALRERGTLLHSYLEDGFGALFRCCTTVAGWAYLERYVVEDLLGAKLSHCIGGLTHDPIKRAGWVFALNNIHSGECVGSMIYGDTISFGSSFTDNRALVAEYLQWDILAQLRSPSGHAVLPLPVTEAIRIPSDEEIAEAHVLGRRIEQTARRLLPHVDFSAADDFSEQVCRDGQQVFENALAGMQQAGIDTRNPVQILYTLKKLGAPAFETLFGAHATAAIPTDMFSLSQDCVEQHRTVFARPEAQQLLAKQRLLLASSDVHEHAIGALAQLLSESGAEVINLGAEQNPEDIVSAVAQHSPDAILLSTHNGMALDYSQRLKALLDQQPRPVPVIIGGVLNQKVDHAELPVPVIDELTALGFNPGLSLPALPALLPKP